MIRITPSSIHRTLLLSLSCVALSVVPGVAFTATASATVEACPNEQFRTGFSAALPDCRAYELVTPAHKNGGSANEVELGADGSLIAGTNTAWTNDTVGDGPFYSYTFYNLGRTASGWTPTPVSPPSSEFEGFQNPSLGSTLVGRGLAGQTLWEEHGLSTPQNEADVYLQPTPGAPLQDIGPVTPPDSPAGTLLHVVEETGVRVAGFAGDLSHVLFEVNSREGEAEYGWPFDHTEVGPSLYEYVGTATGETRAPVLVGVDDGGHLISQCGTVLGRVGTDGRELGIPGHNSVSAAGSSVFFTARHAGAGHCAGTGPTVNELYARVEHSAGQYETVSISEPDSLACACDTAPAIRQPGYFVAGSEDGSKVFFETTQPLLGEDTTDNIYEYDLDGPAGDRLTRVSGGDSTVSGPAADVQGVVQVSEDGSRVYFVAAGELTRTPNQAGQMAQPGADNLYVFDTQTHSTEFIATLSAADNELWENYAGKSDQEGADATPDGRFLVFTSSTPALTPDDTSTAPQAFEYDSQTRELVRVSVGQGGYNSNGNAERYAARIVGAGPRRTSSATDYWEHLTLSEDGSYVFFTSRNRLTPQAHSPSQNIYEYHSHGRIGEGDVHLVSDGQEVAVGSEGETNALLFGTDPSGADVFFTTVDPLVPQDTDTAQDIYDARIDGGFPPPASFDECTGEECQGQLSAAPTSLSPGSELQVGGNPPLAAAVSKAKPKPKAKAKPKKCRKGTTRKQGRCVKQKAKSKNRRTSR